MCKSSEKAAYKLQNFIKIAKRSGKLAIVQSIGRFRSAGPPAWRYNLGQGLQITI